MSERAEQIRNSIKEWLESGEKDLSEEIQNLLQYRADRERPTRRIIDRYKDGSLSLHFHFSEGSNKISTDPQIKFCAVAQFIVPQIDNVTPNLERSVGSDRRCEIKRSVLVDVVEIAHRPQRILPTNVRLQTLDYCLGVCGNALEPAFFDLIREEFRRGADGEHIVAVWPTSGIFFNQLPDDMIQGRPEIVKTIADDYAQFEGRSRQSNLENADIRIRVFLGHDLALAFFHRAQDFDDRVEMFLCPDNFKPSPV